MLFYRNLIHESTKRKSRLLNRKGGFLFEEDSEEAKRHRKDPIFDQMFELTEVGLRFQGRRNTSNYFKESNSLYG